MPNETAAGNATISKSVAEIKLIARNALRAKLISPRLAKIGEYENRIAGLNKDIADTNEEIDVEVYELGKLDTKHPRYEKQKKEAEESIASLKKHVEALNADIKSVQELLDAQNKGIALIESGETKVNADELAELVDKLIVENAREKTRDLA